jgi:hypothetical protein
MPETPLRPAAVQLHQALLVELQVTCKEGDKDIEKLLANAVYTSEAFIAQLYQLLPDESFTDPDEEIFFFKTIKPLFTAEREYHQRLYHANVFGTGNDSFWEHECTRMQKILFEHHAFADYYHNGYTHNDYPWFRQGQAPIPTTLCMHEWETNPRHTSARDSWVGGLVAVERYRDWLKGKTLNNIK